MGTSSFSTECRVWKLLLHLPKRKMLDKLKINSLSWINCSTDWSNCSKYHTISLSSHTSKVMLKIIQARLQQYINFKMFKLILEKAEEPEIKLPTSIVSLKNKRVPDKHLFLLYGLCQSLWLCCCCCCCVTSVMSDSVRHHRQQPTRFCHP